MPEEQQPNGHNSKPHEKSDSKKPSAKKLGCFQWVLIIAFSGCLLFLVVTWALLFREAKLRISPETTYLTEPTTPDGKRIDYFAAIEKKRYRPEMATEANGYRLIVEKLGPPDHEKLRNFFTGEIKISRRDYLQQFMGKLGLDPRHEPTLHYESPYDYLDAWVEDQEEENRSAYEIYKLLNDPWLEEDLPMMVTWLEENGPALDLVAEALRKPVFITPLIRDDPDEIAFWSLKTPYLSEFRSYARGFAARANYALGKGDFDAAIDDILNIERLASAMAEEPVMLDLIVSIALQCTVDMIAVAPTKEKQPDQEQLERLFRELANPPVKERFVPLVNYKRLFVLDAAQAFAHEEMWFDALYDKDHTPDWLKEQPQLHYLAYDWNVVLEEINHIVDETIRNEFPLQRLVLLPTIFWGSRAKRSEFFAGLLSEIFSGFAPQLEATRRQYCCRNMRRIALAMLLYEREHGRFPPAWTEDDGGNRLHSWRVLLLPQLGEEELYKKIRLDEPWDSEHNRQFHGAAIPFYRCPSAELDPGETTYAVVVGQQTAFRGPEGTRLEDFRALRMNKVLVVETESGACWMDPEADISMEDAMLGINRMQNHVVPTEWKEKGIQPKRTLGSEHPGGMDAAFTDGRAFLLSETTLEEELREYLDITDDGVDW